MQKKSACEVRVCSLQYSEYRGDESTETMVPPQCNEQRPINDTDTASYLPPERTVWSLVVAVLMYSSNIQYSYVVETMSNCWLSILAVDDPSVVS